MTRQTVTESSLARRLQALQTRVLISGALVLAATVTLAVWGPALDLPYLRDDARHWSAGALLAGGLLLVAVHGWLLRPLGRLAHLARGAQSAPNEAGAAEAALQRELVAAERTIRRLRTELQAALQAAPAPAEVAVRPAVPALPVVQVPPSGTAGRDALTGLLSAAAFEAQLALFLQRSRAGQAAALLLIDLDRFKHLNETAGRAAGDGVLRQAAAVLQAHVREGDAVARLDGDTFALLLPGCVAAVALQMGERLRAALGTLGVDHAGQRVGVGATVGVAELEDASSAGAGSDAAAAWMARAQAAWYEAKYAGRGSVRVAATRAEVPLVVPA